MAEEFTSETPRYDKKAQREILDLASRLAADDARKASQAELERRGEEMGLRADQVQRAILLYETKPSRSFKDKIVNGAKVVVAPIRFVFRTLLFALRGLFWIGGRGRRLLGSAYQFEKKTQP